jgi:hypothetical protein
MARNVDKAKRAARLAKVERCIALQMSSREIEAKICAEDGVVDRTVRADIDLVLEQMEYEAARERPKLKAKMRRSLRTVYQHAMSAKNHGAAKGALSELCKIDGLYAPEQVRHEVRGELDVRVDQMTSGDRRTRIVQLLEKAGVTLSGGQARPVNGTNGHGSNGTNGAGGSGHNGHS